MWNRILNMLTFVKVGIIEEIILIPALKSSDKGKPFKAALVDIWNLFPCKKGHICRFGRVIVEQGKRGKRLKDNVHGVIDGSEHLNHELWVEQHAVAWFPPELLLLTGKTANTQPEEETHVCTHISSIRAARDKWCSVFKTQLPSNFYGRPERTINSLQVHKVEIMTS